MFGSANTSPADPRPTESCSLWRYSCQMRKRWGCTITTRFAVQWISRSSSSSSVLIVWFLFNLAIRHFSMRRIKEETSSQLSTFLRKTNHSIFPTASQLWNWSAAIEKPKTPRVRLWSDVSHCNALSLFLDPSACAKSLLHRVIVWLWFSAYCSNWATWVFNMKMGKSSCVPLSLFLITGVTSQQVFSGYNI